MEAAIENNDLELFKANCPQDMVLDNHVINMIVRLKRFSFIDYICEPENPRSDINKRELAHKACFTGNYEVFTYDTLKFRYRLNTLQFAIEGGNIEIVNEILNDRPLSSLNNAYSNKLVARAVVRKRHDMIEYLIQEGVPVNLSSLSNILPKLGGLSKYRDTLRFTHDLDIQRDPSLRNNWGCERHTCVHCSDRKKEIICDHWFLESHIFQYNVQWLPQEMMEDTFSLF